MTVTDRASPILVACVAGARPNFVKVAPLLRALRARPLFDARLVHTGQHRDPALSSVLIEELGIPPPDAQLGITAGSHAHQTAEIMRGFEDVLAIMQPQVVVVFGDVDSTLACALASAKFSLREPFTTARGPQVEERRRPLLVHVEAGLRSFDDDMPEEVNRRITDALSDLLCVSEPAGLANLQREGIPDDRIVFAGNIMIDSLTAARDLAGRSPVLGDLGLQGVAYGVVTLHRPSNVDDPVVLQRILGALDGVARELPLVFPVHPRTRERLQAAQVKLEAPRWRLIEPLGYAAFLRLLGGARMALTDSGGVQEETTVLGVPCLTLRDDTERPITVEQGTNQLVGTRPEVIAAGFRRAMTTPIRASVPRAWDGNAAERIADHLQRLFEPATITT